MKKNRRLIALATAVSLILLGCTIIPYSPNPFLSSLWFASLSGNKLSEFVVENGSLYVVMNQGADSEPNQCKLYCMESKTGKRLWAIYLNSIQYPSKYLYGLVIGDKYIYVPCTDKLLAINKNTGKIENSIKGKVESNLSNSLNGFSYIVIGDQLLKVDVNLCTIKSRTTLVEIDKGLSIIHQLSNQVHVLSTSGYLYSFSLPDCNLKYKTKLFSNLQPNDTPYFAYNSNKLVIADKSDNKNIVKVIEADNGNKIWEKELKRVFQPVVSDDGLLFINSYCIKLGTGDIVWFNRDLSDFVNYVTIYHNYVYYFTKYREYRVVEFKTGKLIKNNNDFSGPHLFYRPVVCDNTIYCLSTYSMLNAYISQIDQTLLNLDSHYMEVGTNTVWTNYKPVTKKGEVYVNPVTVIDSLGGSTINDINSGSCELNGKHIVYFVGKYGQYKNEVVGDTKYTIDAINVENDGITGVYLPLRMVLEYYNLKVAYKNNGGTIIISR